MNIFPDNNYMGQEITRREGKHRLGRIAAIILIGAFGLGIGWVAGKALTDTIPRAASETSPAGPAEPQPQAPQPQPAPPPVARPEPKDEEADGPLVIPTDERSAKEMGRKALKKILKEIEGHIDGEKRAGKHKNKAEKK
jgi:hypothetical protein